MKNFLLFLGLLLWSKANMAQLLTTSVDFPKDNDNIVITMDATKGNGGLNNYANTNDVYVHTGVITSASTGANDWKYVREFGVASAQVFTTAIPQLKATSIGNNKYTYSITNIRSFYGVPAGETILKISILFRNGNGTIVQRNVDGSDMYLPIYANALAVRFVQPPYQPMFVPIPELISKTVGDNITVTPLASNPSTIKIFFNGTLVQTSAANATTTTTTQNITALGTQKFLVEATQGAVVVKDSFSFDVSPIQALPAGVREGINYGANNTEVTLVLYAPNKTRAHIIGEFNGWIKNDNSLMNKTPDGIYYWKKITGLTAGTPYSYQYVVDDVIRIADPYTELILDKDNDGAIQPSTYPNLKAYPTGFTTELVGVLQTAETPYTFTASGYTRPDKRRMIVYELHLRDFIEAHDFKTLKDTLNYLQNLGVNTIHVMPFNEFEGNDSWGYNPSYYFAPDKYYGPKNRVKEFIDECHKKGIAVVMDMVLNHACGQSAYAKLYFNSGAQPPSPAGNNPWLNVAATHPFNVCFDFNHTAPATKYLVDRVVEHWLTEYKLDGFRWDLSKGFVQNTGGNWENYNAERIATWKRIYDYMQTKSPGSYCILEHLGGNDEEKELANYGMMPWGKLNINYNQATMGHPSGPEGNWNFEWGIHTARGFANPHLLTYQESHDEERLMVRNKKDGNSNGSYNIQNLYTGLRRNEEAAAFFLMQPGPKLIWQFGELGYDESINRCPDGTINDNCRTSSKPIRWGYFTDIYRRRLYDIYASLINLRKLKPNAFVSNSIGYNLGGAFKWLQVTDPSLNITVVGNFDVVPLTGTVTFQTAGTWYNYLGGGTFTATGAPQSITLQAGEYYVYINQNINGAVFTPVNNVADPIKNMRVLVYPNPVIENAFVEYDLPENGTVQVNVMNQTGQVLGEVFKGYKTKGTHSFVLNTNNFNAKSLSNGVYLLQISVNNKKRIEKIIIQ
jgi:glycosidase